MVSPLISVFANEAISKRIADGAWDKDRRRDVEAAVAIFVAANGNIPVSDIEQSHLIATKDIFPKLPLFTGASEKMLRRCLRHAG